MGSGDFRLAENSKLYLRPSGKMLKRLRRKSESPAAGVYLPMFHKGANPLFQYSTIPSFQLWAQRT